MTTFCGNCDEVICVCPPFEKHSFGTYSLPQRRPLTKHDIEVAHKAYANLIKNLYTLQEIGGMTDEWVYDTAHEVEGLFGDNTGYSLETKEHRDDN